MQTIVKNAKSFRNYLKSIIREGRNAGMNIDMKLIDELINNLNSEIDELTVELDKTETELLILETNKKELDLQYEDEQKIINSYSAGKHENHAVFSPFAAENENDELSELKKKEMETLLLQIDLMECKLSAKKSERDYIAEKVNADVDQLTYMQSIKSNIKKQVDDYNNEYFVKQLKEIFQKKRLITLEKTKYSPVVSKMETQVLEPFKENLNQLGLVLNFIQTDPVRAKQELDKMNQQMKVTVDKTSKLIEKYRHVEPDRPLCDSLNSYIGDLVQIYPDIKFRMTVANLKQVNNINMDLNRCLMALFRGLINAFILKCNPLMIYLRFAYEDGYLNVTGKVIGTYINFYNEMKLSPTSIIANMYEKVFLLNGTIVFKNNNDGTFNVKMGIPIKNYLT